MMNTFVAGKRSSYVVFHNISMLKNPFSIYGYSYIFSIVQWFVRFFKPFCFTGTPYTAILFFLVSINNKLNAASFAYNYFLWFSQRRFFNISVQFKKWKIAFFRTILNSITTSRNIKIFSASNTLFCNPSSWFSYRCACFPVIFTNTRMRTKLCNIYATFLNVNIFPTIKTLFYNSCFCSHAFNIQQVYMRGQV
jgi:hypothetical protein